MEERKVKFDFSSNFQLKGWGLYGGSGEDFYKCLWSLTSSGKDEFGCFQGFGP